MALPHSLKTALTALSVMVHRYNTVENLANRYSEEAFDLEEAMNPLLKKLKTHLNAHMHKTSHTAHLSLVREAEAHFPDVMAAARCSCVYDESPDIVTHAFALTLSDLRRIIAAIGSIGETTAEFARESTSPTLFEEAAELAALEAKLIAVRNNIGA